MKKIILTAASLFVIVITNAIADEEYNHFPSLEAPNTTVALCNLASFNKKLKTIADKEKLSAEDMVKVHELTYTLENAVMRLQQELEVIAIDLEKVHKASEVLDQGIIKASGKKYLRATTEILLPANCK
jgi:site-specific recombinase